MASPNLAIVRRLEAAGFRAWPAACVEYDGAWAVRLTEGYSSRRLNSVNPLDPGDTRNIEARVERVAGRFQSFGRRPCFRLTPLAPVELDAHLEAVGWKRFEESIVMTCDLQKLDLAGAGDVVPLDDMERFADGSQAIHERAPELRSGFCEILARIGPNKGMFVLERDGRAVSNALCVQDGEMAGLFDVGTLPAERRKGHGRAIIASALKWAKSEGAKTAWLQIGADNAAGIALYEAFGFQEAYRYAYRESNGI
ncbi:GNAT family N-acetyltransferase [Falsochrobactrum sp. TDYN1]|uniref:GNAT family N-acetyltransferase n=1 Tax=Falsochrobactrum tianjinense TaxID=2706015 RepID=A0A949PJR5_9HYPH|nr:GNAT family N-acetyltransferase [Falsochrobactrum sp. TDYN1]MBV2141893.1 GNAT family N-acetyltransferase [Falsochrobactrum sp. TDYN1]